MAALLIAGLVLAPTLLMLAYKVLPPVSTPMLARHLAGREVVREWRSLDEVSPQVVRAVVMSEDGGYCVHRGVDWGTLRALLREGTPTRGGSTIAMQVARNLFLWRSRPGEGALARRAAYLRKAIEIPLALMLDRVMGKRRLMEIYLNIAEWDGGGVFGIAAGARAQLGRDARDLGRDEAARMAAVLPNPIAFDAMRGARTERIAALVARRMRGAAPWVACIA